MKAPIKLRAGIIGLALTFYLLLQFLSQFPDFVEEYYSNGLYPFLTLFISNLSSHFSFSISEFLLWSILLVGIPFIFVRIRQQRMSLTRIFLNLLVTIAVFYVWFYLFWGINYFRPSLNSKLGLDRVELPMDAFDSTFVRIIRNTNDLNPAYSVRPIAQIDSTINASYDAVLDSLGLPKPPGYRGLKTFAINWLLNKTTTSGWFSPFLHEIHYNSDLFFIETPFVIAHEKAHQMGYTSEAEANFLAHLVCTNSNDPLARYSGYFQILGYFLNSVRLREGQYEQYFNQLSKGVQLDLMAVQTRWQNHRGFISDLANKGYDLYLKANHVEEGIQNYSMVVDLLVRFYQYQSLSGSQ